MSVFSRKLGVDLGTVNVSIAERDVVLLHEPAIVAITIDEEKIVSVGQEARLMYGRAPENMQVMRPMHDGVIADYEVTEAMLRYFIGKVTRGMQVFKPDLVMSVPYGVTSVERRAVHEAALQAGARDAYLMPETLAAAMGSGLPVQTPSGNMVDNIGGGTSEAAVVAMHGIIAASSQRVGGVRLDQAIIQYVRRKYNLMIGEITAEYVKINIGAAVDLPEDLEIEVQGRDQVDGLPKTIRLATGEIVEALTEPLESIASVVRKVLERTPPELAADIIDRGMMLTGGGGQLRNLDRLLTQQTGVPCYVAEDPISCVAIGAGKALENYRVMRRVLPTT